MIESRNRFAVAFVMVAVMVGCGGASSESAGGAAGEGGTGGVIPVREWGTAVLIQASDEEAGLPQVAFDPTGNAIAVWSQSDGTHVNVWANRLE